jgi:hypothetical protein
VSSRVLLVLWPNHSLDRRLAGGGGAGRSVPVSLVR